MSADKAAEAALLKELATVFAHSVVERLLSNDARWAPFAVVRTRQVGARQHVELRLEGPQEGA